MKLQFSENFLSPESPSEHFAALFCALYEPILEYKNLGLKNPDSSKVALWSHPYIEYECKFKSNVLGEQKSLEFDFRTGSGYTARSLNEFDTLQALFSDEQSFHLDNNVKDFANSMGMELEVAKGVWKSLKDQHKKIKAFVPKEFLPLLSCGFVDEGKVSSFYEKILMRPVHSFIKAGELSSVELLMSQKCALAILGGQSVDYMSLSDELTQALRAGVNEDKLEQRIEKMCVSYMDAMYWDDPVACQMQVREKMLPLKSVIEVVLLRQQIPATKKNKKNPSTKSL